MSLALYQFVGMTDQSLDTQKFRSFTQFNFKIPRLHRAVLERVSWFAGVEVGRRVRNVREFKEALDLEESDGSEAHDQEESDYCDDY